MTWGSFATRSLTLVVVTPLILTRLTTEEIALWYLFSTFIGLQLLADFGFTLTFTRVIAYGMGGASIHELTDFRNIVNTKNSLGQPNWKTIEQICSTMNPVYFRLTFISISVLAIFGTLVLRKPIEATANTSSAWLSWFIILFAFIFTLWGNQYNAYLQGVNQVALLRKWEMFTSLGAIATSCVVLLLGGGLLGLVIANQSWLILNILRNRWLCGLVEEGYFKKIQGNRINPDILKAVWPSSWRSALGVLMTYGLVQISGIIYAQVGSASEVASYLLSLRLIQVVSQFSQAPFYSKLPALAKLRSEGNVDQQIKIAQRGMSLSYWSYTLGFVLLGILGQPLLQLINSNAEFADPLLWSVMGLAIFAERYGAMHLNLYSTTNHIISHIANGVTGIIYIVVSLSLFSKIGVYAFPLGLLAGYLGFYCWYSVKHSYQAFGLKFWQFEKNTSLVPFCIILLFSIINILDAEIL